MADEAYPGIEELYNHLEVRPPPPEYSGDRVRCEAWTACERKRVEGATRKAVNRVLRDERLEKTLALKGLPPTPTPSGESDTLACLRLIARALAKEAAPATAVEGRRYQARHKRLVVLEQLIRAWRHLGREEGTIPSLMRRRWRRITRRPTI